MRATSLDEIRKDAPKAVTSMVTAEGDLKESAKVIPRSSSTQTPTEPTFRTGQEKLSTSKNNPDQFSVKLGLRTNPQNQMILLSKEKFEEENYPEIDKNLWHGGVASSGLTVDSELTKQFLFMSQYKDEFVVANVDVKKEMSMILKHFMNDHVVDVQQAAERIIYNAASALEYDGFNKALIRAIVCLRCDCNFVVVILLIMIGIFCGPRFSTRLKQIVDKTEGERYMKICTDMGITEKVNKNMKVSLTLPRIMASFPGITLWIRDQLHKMGKLPRNIKTKTHPVLSDLSLSMFCNLERDEKGAFKINESTEYFYQFTVILYKYRFKNMSKKEKESDGAETLADATDRMMMFMDLAISSFESDPLNQLMKLANVTTPTDISKIRLVDILSVYGLSSNINREEFLSYLTKRAGGYDLRQEALDELQLNVTSTIGDSGQGLKIREIDDFDYIDDESLVLTPSTRLSDAIKKKKKDDFAKEWKEAGWPRDALWAFGDKFVAEGDDVKFLPTALFFLGHDVLLTKSEERVKNLETWGYTWESWDPARKQYFTALKDGKISAPVAQKAYTGSLGAARGKPVASSSVAAPPVSATTASSSAAAASSLPSAST